MGAEYSFYMKSIETHARAFLALIILGIGTVKSVKNGDGDFSEQFALFLINQKNKINNTLWKRIS